MRASSAVLLILAACVPPRPPVPALPGRACEGRVPVAFTWYTVGGATLKDAVAQMEAQAPNGDGWPGLTHVEARWRCVEAPVEVSLDAAVTVHLPDWPAGRRAQDAAWARFDQGLRTHEMGHVGIALDTLDCLEAELAQASTCADARTRFQAAYARMNERNAAFDTSTNHGRF